MNKYDKNAQEEMEAGHWKAINALWMKMEQGKLDAEIDWSRKILKTIRDDAAVAAFERNSSYFMRKAGEPLIFLREGVNKDNIVDYIIMAGKILDEHDIRNEPKYYVNYPDWMIYE